VHARPELRRDDGRIIYAADGLAARAAYDAFLKNWSTLCAPVARCVAARRHRRRSAPKPRR